MSGVAIIGVGPYCQRTYLPMLRRLGVEPRLVVELESRAEASRQILNALGFEKARLLLLSDDRRGDCEFPTEFRERLDRALEEAAISHVILSCEPRGRKPYLIHFARRGLRLLCDKPLTAPRNASTTELGARRVWQDFLDVRQAARRGNARLHLNVQRRISPIYQAMRELLDELSSKYGVPVTSLEIFASDGTWNFPLEFLERENHPYRHGYGKLMHSGYHFVDLLTGLLSIGDRSALASCDEIELSTQSVSPQDTLAAFGDRSYETFFPQREWSGACTQLKSAPRLGEVDVFSNWSFRKRGCLYTHASMNLLSSGFSCRAWPDLPADTYRGNGRVRHERVCAQAGPLLSVQAHHYQFDDSRRGTEPRLLVFRNHRLIGGEAFSTHAFSPHEVGSETLQSIFVRQFLADELGTSSLEEHAPSIRLLSLACRAVATEKTINERIERNESRVNERSEGVDRSNRALDDEAHRARHLPQFLLEHV